MKVLINKDVFEIVSEILVKWDFDFWVVRWMKCLILVGFDDMGYDMGYDMGLERLDLGFCLILLEN